LVEMTKKLYRSQTDKKLFGLCGGLADMLGVDATLLRLVVIVTTFFTGGALIAIYFIAALIIPKEPTFNSPMMSGWNGYGTAEAPMSAGMSGYAQGPVYSGTSMKSSYPTTAAYTTVPSVPQAEQSHLDDMM
jgi:phage shock protein C